MKILPHHSSESERDQQLVNAEAFRDTHAKEAAPRLAKLQQVVRERKKTFEALIAAKVCSLGSMSHAVDRQQIEPSPRRQHAFLGDDQEILAQDRRAFLGSFLDIEAFP